jgi:CRISPR system Cascade subunit CasA
MPQFDLRKEPWIPCLARDGQREMSLVDVLTETHAIREIVGDSPPVTIALHRLLLAILHRIYRGPQDENEWNPLHTAGRFDAEKITRYFDDFHDRFDLFHETHPFYQTPAVREKVKDGAVIKLYFHSGNNATLFDHTSISNPKELSPAEAARLVVMIQAFDTGGQITGDNGADSAKAAPLIQSAVALVRGETLFETLMLNLHRYCGEDGSPFVFEKDKDLPAWERNEPTIRGSRLPSGPVDLLTWQSRRVALEPEEDKDGKLVVRKAVVMAGHSFPDGMEIHTKETMMAFRKSNDGRMFSVGFSESRDLWRNSLSLLKAIDIAEGSRPRMLDWMSQLRSNGYLQRDRLPVDFCGIAADKAKLLFWNHERFDLSLAYLEDNDLTQRLGTCLEFSEAMGSALRAGVKVLADALETERPTFATEANFWSQMELRFHRLLGELPEEKGDEEMVAWFRDTQRTAKDALRNTVNGLSGSAAENKAAVAAENALHSAIGKAIKAKANEWAPYLPERFSAKGGNQ